MNVPTEQEIKRMWWAEQPETAKAMYREWPTVAASVFRMRGMVESVTVCKSDGKTNVVVYESAAD